jgi:hypothetical protein
MRKQRPYRDRVIQLIEQGASDRSISERLKINRKYVSDVRAELGVAPFTWVRSIDEQLAAYCSIAGPDGHVWWTGSVSGSSGAPRIRVRRKEVPAAHVIFERRAGRPAVGQVRADCGVKHCVAPSHVMDDVERRKVRLQTRALLGYPDHWKTCSTCGGDWDAEGRVEEKLSLYCRRCATERARINKRGTAS